MLTVINFKKMGIRQKIESFIIDNGSITIDQLREITNTEILSVEVIQVIGVMLKDNVLTYDKRKQATVFSEELQSIFNELNDLTW